MRSRLNRDTFTKEDVHEIMLEAFHKLVDEAEEWGLDQALAFYHYSSGATALIYHIENLMEVQDGNV